MLVNTGDKRGFVPKWMDWRRDVASGGGVRHTVGIIKKSEQRSNGKRTEDRTCEAIRKRETEGRSRVILSNAPEIEVGDCSIVVVVLCATSIGAYVAIFGTQTSTIVYFKSRLPESNRGHVNI